MLTTKKVLQPGYYDKFHCIGNACEDNCCYDWAINIDKRTYLMYKGIKDPDFVKKMPERIKRIKGPQANDQAYARFVLDEKARCKFQQEDGLCEIHAKFGPRYLCHTCQVYPRKMSMVIDDVVEESLTMSCPEAVRVALLSPEPMTFLLSEKEYKIGQSVVKLQKRKEGDNSVLEHAWAIREACIDLLQNRSHPLAQRIFLVGMVLSKVTELWEAGQSEAIPQTLQRYLSAVQSGDLSDALSSVPHNEDIQGSMATTVIRIVRNHAATRRPTYQIFRQVMQRFLEDIVKDKEKITLEDDHQFTVLMYEYFTARQKQHFPAFLEQYGHVVENYLVNYVFSSIFPFTYYNLDMSPYLHFVALAEQYAMLRILLCVSAGEEGITQEQLVHIMTVLSNVNQHGDTPKRIINAYREEEADSLAHMAFLLKDE